MISRATRLALSAGLTLFLGFVFTPMGCGGAVAEFDPAIPVQADAELPEEVARQISMCAAEHKTHLGSAPHVIAFDVKLESDGEVDSVALRGSTIRDEELEACMAKALRSLTEDDLPMRRSESDPRGPVAPESRTLMGQPQLALACLFSPPCALTALVIAGAATIALTGLRAHRDPSAPETPPPTTARCGADRGPHGGADRGPHSGAYRHPHGGAYRRAYRRADRGTCVQEEEECLPGDVRRLRQ
jgi:hypothetical protein